MTMHYVVKGKYIRGSEIQLDQFDHLNEAKDFVDKKLLEDEALSIKVIYRIYQFDELIKEYDPNKVHFSLQRDILKKQAEQKSSSGKGNHASFRPTPISVTPKLPGTPQKWLIDKEDKKE